MEPCGNLIQAPNSLSYHHDSSVLQVNVEVSMGLALDFSGKTKVHPQIWS